MAEGCGLNSSVQVRAITTLAGLRELEDDWFRLWMRCPTLTIFQSPDWLLPWTEVFEPSRPWVLEARREGVLVLLAPLLIYGTQGDRIVAPLGAGISDYLDVLVDRDVPEALDALVDYLLQSASQWTELRFPDLPRSSLLLRSDILSRFDQQNFDHEDADHIEQQLSHCDACPRLNLPGSIDALRTVVPAKQLRNIRNAGRRLSSAQVEVATQSSLGEFLDALFRLHEKRWQLDGETGVLADPRVQELHRRVAPRLLGRGMLRLFGLRHHGALIACLMAFFEKNAARLYLQGYDPDWAGCSPGAQLVGAALEHAIREGKCVADFMRGRETYKYYWGAQDVHTFQLRVRSSVLAQTHVPEKSVA